MHVEDAATSVPDGVLVMNRAWPVHEVIARLDSSSAERALIQGANGRWLLMDLPLLRVAMGSEQTWRALQRGSPVDGNTRNCRYVEPVYPDEWLDVALRQLAKAPVVPVISRLDHTHLLGVVTRDDVRRAYGFEHDASSP